MHPEDEREREQAAGEDQARDQGRSTFRSPHDPVPTETGETRDSERGEGQELAGKPELPEAREQRRQQPVEPAITVSELSIEAKAGLLGRVVWTDPGGDCPGIARPPERA